MLVNSNRLKRSRCAMMSASEGASVMPTVPKKEEPPKKRKSSEGNQTWKNNPDEYEVLYEPKRVLVSETPSYKGDDIIRKYVEVSVKRAGEFGLPTLFIQEYQESNRYTGYLRGRCVTIPLKLETINDTLALIKAAFAFNIDAAVRDKLYKEWE